MILGASRGVAGRVVAMVIGGFAIFIMGLWGMCCVEPGRLVDKDRGLWTLRREFESRPGYLFRPTILNLL